jgi:hypothetical protein
MATAVDKWPAYARLSAVAQAGHLPHSSYTITRDTTRLYIDLKIFLALELASLSSRGS